MNDFDFSEGPMERKNLPEKWRPQISNINDSNVSIFEIPVIIFNEVSMRFGLGDDFDIENDGHSRVVQPLDSDHCLTGFAGAIGFHNFMGRNIFVLWDRVPKPSNIETVFEEKALLTITAGVGETRFHGGSYPNDVWVKLSNQRLFGLSLGNLSMKLIPLIIWRAAQLAQEHNFKFEEYWDQNSEQAQLIE